MIEKYTSSDATEADKVEGLILSWSEAGKEMLSDLRAARFVSQRTINPFD